VDRVNISTAAPLIKADLALSNTGYLIDLTGSWTLPFAGSIALLLVSAGLAFRMHPDRPFEAGRAAQPVTAAS
jgi:hypothetical protein